MSAELTNIEALALHKLSVKHERSSVEPGTYAVDVRVHVKGNVSIGKSGTSSRLAISATDLAHALASKVNADTLESVIASLKSGAKPAKSTRILQEYTSSARAGSVNTKGLEVAVLFEGMDYEAPELLLESA